MDIYGYFEDIVNTYGYAGIFIVSYLESVIQPVPPDIFIIGAAAFGLSSVICAFIATFGSLFGGLTGYYLGKRLGNEYFIKIFGEKNYNRGFNYFKKYGVWAVVIAGFSPLPYKVFAWLAGVFNMNPIHFAIGTLIGRLPRFLLIAYFGYGVGILFGITG
ncbi:SNARE associated Golgi protein [Methanococcus vannielii SB]|jgi:membrane protein YqaA with SNARE-associated domain|uniref:SNARE associated Golgi protein n=1 Tax=Methanococcus vannielii (strain ATCC 35089 / DSM 1224 / JCM 13029 / OCM 148 / SB) TaxID=406327 RepID=A6UN55_METVS|nr:YqaA family protein [Methanococcus vannielii]ABR53927.1 SNARE associated Golgi protein [Methanococcus vannielii SB]